jgi:hypothetical protein
MMTDTVSSGRRRLGRRLDGLWSRLRTAWLQVSLGKAAGRTSPTFEVFSERFDRCFRRTSFYVSRRVSDRETLERIVTRVLVENLELFNAQCDPLEEVGRLKASADRLLALEAATSPGAVTPSGRLEDAVDRLEETGS